ncbi:hypothetical protein EDD21DRAFT_380442 [Dissophora ornata]|nr:hypothetical protein EDD21DRAFT_380442 [Dissophora ornata]
MASATSSSPIVPVHHHNRPLLHHGDSRSHLAPYLRASDPHLRPLGDHASNSSSAAMSSKNLHTGPTPQQGASSKSTPSATSSASKISTEPTTHTADKNSSGSLKVSPEFQKQGEDTIREILDRLQKRQDEFGPIPSIPEPQDVQRSVHTQKLNPELLEKTINPHTLRQHHGDANLRHEG